MNNSKYPTGGDNLKFQREIITNEKPSMIDIMFNPKKYGYISCNHCNGYGSSLKDSQGVNSCTICGGSGLIKDTNL